MFCQVQRLRQRAKRQGEVGRGSRESVEAPREDEVILSLKKKYEDLLQYVLKVILVLLVFIARKLSDTNFYIKKNKIILNFTWGFLCHFSLL